MMTLVEAVRTCLSDKYFTISGRASRAEFWWFYLVDVLGTLLLASGIGVVAALFKSEGGMLYLLLLLLLAMGMIALAIPTITVSVRRLHEVRPALFRP